MNRTFFYIAFLCGLFWINKPVYAQHLIKVGETNGKDSVVYNAENLCHTAIRPFLDSEVLKSKKFDVVQTSSGFWGIVRNKNLLQFDKDSLNLFVNPLIMTEIEFSSVDNSTRFLRAAGVSVGGRFKEKLAWKVDVLGYESEFASSTVNNSKLIALPHFGKPNNYDAKTNLLSGVYWQGYLGYSPSRHFNFVLGNGRNFIGDGYRSLLLSANSAPYGYFKLNLSVWKLKYSILYTWLRDLTNPNLSQDLARKHAVIHTLSWNITKKISVYAFESVIWNPIDSLGNRNFDVNYASPFVFFRPVEFSLGSPDNVLLGIGSRFNIFGETHIYGQILIDEFAINELLKNNGWWGNKYAIQAGFLAHKPFGISGLFVRGEFNMARPFTYAHDDAFRCYSNEGEALAHPLGANFQEGVFILQQHKNRWRYGLKVVAAVYGDETGNSEDFWGHDIYKPYTNRVAEYGNDILQGKKTKLINAEASFRYLINQKWNLSFDASIAVQHYSTDAENRDFVFFKCGIKTSLFNSNSDY